MEEPDKGKNWLSELILNLYRFFTDIIFGKTKNE